MISWTNIDQKMKLFQMDDIEVEQKYVGRKLNKIKTVKLVSFIIKIYHQGEI